MTCEFRTTYGILMILGLGVGGGLFGCSESFDTVALSANDESGQDDMGDSMRSIPQGYSRRCASGRCGEFGLYRGDPIEHGVSTWHRGDPGIGFPGELTVLQALDGYAGHSDTGVNCYRLFLLGDWEDDVEMAFTATYHAVSEAFLEEITTNEAVDAFYYYFREIQPSDVGDPVSQYQFVLDPGHWIPVELFVQSPQERGLIRFELSKSGKGNAVLYYLEIAGALECPDDAVRLNSQ